MKPRRKQSQQPGRPKKNKTVFNWLSKTNTNIINIRWGLKKKQANCQKHGKSGWLSHVMACDGVRYGWKFSGPLTERSKGKPKQTRITCGTQSKIVLSQGAYQNWKYHRERVKSPRKHVTWLRLVFSLESDWLRNSREFSGTIIERSQAYQRKPG